MSRKLDAAIAEALGYEIVWEKESWEKESQPMISKESFLRVRLQRGTRQCFYHSSCPHEMLRLISEMRVRGWHYAVTDEGSWERKAVHYVRFSNPRSKKSPQDIPEFYDGQDDWLPKAVALAAHKALTGEEWTE